MMLVFKLSMPNIGSWNGKWSGGRKLFAITRRNPNKENPIQLPDLKKSYYYDFKDGWGASVSVQKMTATEANKIMRKSAGFRGYDWMVNSILKHNYITEDSQ